MLAEFVQTPLECDAVELLNRQCDESLNPCVQCLEGLEERLPPGGVAAGDADGVLDAPVSSDRGAWPHGAHLTCGAVADRDDDIHTATATIGTRALIPTLAAGSTDGDLLLLERHP